MSSAYDKVKKGVKYLKSITEDKKEKKEDDTPSLTDSQNMSEVKRVMRDMGVSQSEAVGIINAANER